VNEPRSANDVVARLAAALSNRYTIERELGAGGMATVYLAHDVKHNRKVAIKVLRPELAAAIGAERFLAEITTTANLQHPHILPLFDSGVAEGRDSTDTSSSLTTNDQRRTTFLYYVMPFIDGESLRDKLTRERQVDIADSIEITRQVAAALAYAHDRGIVHRDIKPENIMLSSGQAIVADFGIARAIGAAGAAQLTAIGSAIGTPQYMSPEQSAGMSDVDGRSDTYSLASVLYEMLTGEAPYTGATSAAIIAKRLGTTAPSVRVLRDSVPKSVDAALQRAMQRAPADRYSSPTEFAAALGENSRATGLHVSRRTATVAFAMLLIAAVLWFAFGNKRTSEGLDADVIAVLPFRVGGSNSTIAYLRESMLDLMQARLSSGSGARTVEPRTLLAAWRRAVGNEKDDLSEDASRALARELGAGRVLLGSVVATPTELTLTGTLLRVSDGEKLAQQSIVGAPDSIATLVNRLTAALLIRNAGEAPEREAGLAAAPLDALQDYLAGRRAYRRGDPFTAMQLYGKALQRDSMFVAAAYSMVATNAWIGTVVTTAGYAVIPQVWRMRDRLNPRDLALFLAIPLVGPNYPAPSSYREIIAQAERAAKLAPDSPESWTLLGQVHGFGPMASETDWATRAAEALDRAIALDSTFATALQARLSGALRVNDTAAMRRYARLDAGLATRGIASGFFDDVFLWAAAQSLGDSAEARQWRDRTTGLSHTEYISKLTLIALHSAATALPLDDAAWAIATLRGAAINDPDRLGLGLAEYAVRFAAGRSDLHDLAGLLDSGPQWAAGLVQQALFEPAYNEVAERLMALEEQGRITMPSPNGPVRWPPFQDCFATLFRMERGDTSNVRASIRRLADYAAARGHRTDTTGAHPIDLRICPLTLEALLESRTAGGSARPALERLDSLMHDGPQWYSGGVDISPTAFANFVVARLRGAQGNRPAALAAIRRREVNYFPAFTWSLPAFLRQEGRLAAMAGDTAGAVRAYDQYLTLRTDPDPPFKPQHDSVVAERAALPRK
jgi:tetratricopeptide (TPR) repeat protein